MPHAKRIITGKPDVIAFKLLSSNLAAARELVRAGIAKSDDCYDVRVRMVRRHRSTGPGSASAHFHGHCGQIAGELGYTTDQMKYVLKCEAGALGYPSTIYKGLVIPQSEADATPEEESFLIDTCHRVAAESGIILREE